jgi:hypothetical protein
MQAAAAAGAGRAHSNMHSEGVKMAKVVGPKKAAQLQAANKALQQSVKHYNAAGKPSSPNSYAAASAAAAAATTSRLAGRVVPSRLCQPTASSLAKAKPGHGPAAAASAAPGTGETKPRLKSKIVVHKAASSEEMEDEHCSTGAAAAAVPGKMRLKSKVVLPTPGAVGEAADPSLKSLKGQVKEKLAEKARRKVEAEAAQQKSRKVRGCTRSDKRPCLQQFPAGQQVHEMSSSSASVKFCCPSEPAINWYEGYMPVDSTTGLCVRWCIGICSCIQWLHIFHSLYLSME